MPDKFNRPTDPAGALYHAALCGNIEAVKSMVRQVPELIKGKPVIDGAWSHGGRRCGAQDDVITCLHLLIENGAQFDQCHVQTIDSAFKTFPRAATLLFDYGADANAVGGDGTTALHLMAAIGNRDAVGVLLDHGADIDARNEARETPFVVAAALGHTRMMRSLIDQGASGDLPSEARAEIIPSKDPFSAKVCWYRADRSYGYLCDPGRYGDLFFDANECAGTMPPSVEQGTVVTFQVACDAFGLRAVEVEFGP